MFGAKFFGTPFSERKVCLQFAYDLAGVANSKAFRRDILCHDATRTYNAVVSYRNTGKDNSARAYPNIVAYRNGVSVFKPGNSVFNVHGVLFRYNADIRSYKNVVSDGKEVKIPFGYSGENEDFTGYIGLDTFLRWYSGQR